MVLIIFDLLTKVLRNHHESIVLIIFDLLTKVLRNHHEFMVLIILDLLTKLLRKHHDLSHMVSNEMTSLQKKSQNGFKIINPTNSKFFQDKLQIK